MQLSKAHIVIFGIGGVGGYVAEALARTFVGIIACARNEAVTASLFGAAITPCLIVPSRALPSHWKLGILCLPRFKPAYTNPSRRLRCNGIDPGFAIRFRSSS